MTSTLQDKLNAMKDKLPIQQHDEKENHVLSPSQLTFPGWEEGVRGTPNALLRGALFSATQGRSKRFFERELIASLDGYEIRYTGIQLTQSDLNLWETILHISRNRPLGQESGLSLYEILKNMGRGQSSRDYERLKKSLARLRSADVEITIKGNKTYFGALCGISGELDEKTDSYRFKFSEGLICLFDKGWSKLDYDQRKTLGDKPLALWLHGLFSSHARPYPIKVETVHKLCGSSTKNIKHFKLNLKTALNELVEIGHLKSFVIESDLVKVKKYPSKSQIKHMVKGSKT